MAGTLGSPRPMRALIVTNMYPTATRPALGSFVRDQVDALRRIDGIDLDVFSFPPGGARAYLKAAADLRRRGRRHEYDYDVVHAHYGLTAWPAFAASGSVRAVTLHGTDLSHPRARPVTLAALPFLDLVATVSEPLQRPSPTLGGQTRNRRSPRRRGHTTLPPHPPSPGPRDPRPRARPPVPAVPGRPETPGEALRPGASARRRRKAARPSDTIDPAQVPQYVNAANAVLVPSDREGFGLAVLEALACDVPVLATPVGIHPEALNGIEGTYCGPFDDAAWRAALAPHVTDADPRIRGRASAERFSTDLMAANVVAAWRTALEQS